MGMDGHGRPRPNRSAKHRYSGGKSRDQWSFADRCGEVRGGAGGIRSLDAFRL